MSPGVSCLSLGHLPVEMSPQTPNPTGEFRSPYDNGGEQGYPMKSDQRDRPAPTDTASHVSTLPTRSQLRRSRLQARRRARSRVLGWTLLVVVIGAVIVVGFLALRPQSLGGSLAYVEMHGNSMVPTLHDGDLVVAKHQSPYVPGNVVVYRVPTGQPGAGAIVIARIVGGTGATGFVTRGDTSVVPDPVHPRAKDVLGTVRLHVPLVALVSAGVVIAAVIMFLMAFIFRRDGRTGLAAAPAPTSEPALPQDAALVDVPQSTIESEDVKPVDDMNVAVNDPPQVLPVDSTPTVEPEPAPLPEATPLSWAVATPDPIAPVTDTESEPQAVPEAAPDFVTETPVRPAVQPGVEPETVPMADGHAEVYVSATTKDKRRRSKRRSPGPGQEQLPGIDQDAPS